MPVPAIEAYINSLTVDPFDPQLRPYVDAPTKGGGAAAPETPKAAVNAGVVLSFADDLSADERRDVLESVQLAHRAASGELTGNATWNPGGTGSLRC